MVVDPVEGMPGRPVLGRRCSEQFAVGVDGRVGRDHHFLDAVEFAFGQEGRPGKAGRILGQFGRGHQVVVGLAIAGLDPGPVVVGQFHLQRQDGVGTLVGVLDAGALEGCGDVVAVGLPVTRKGLVLARVIVPVGQAQATLVEIGEVALGVALVEGNEGGHNGSRALTTHPAGRGFVGVDGQQFVEG